MAQSIREKARIRQAREGDRPSEDDVAQQRLGWRVGPDDRRQQIAKSKPPRPGPYGLNPADPAQAAQAWFANDKTGISLAHEEKPRRGRGSEVWDERAQRVVELVLRP